MIKAAWGGLLRLIGYSQSWEEDKLGTQIKSLKQQP